MTRLRDRLPLQDGSTFLTDGGLETTLVYQDGIDLPGFAAFPLLETEDGRARLRRYFEPYLAIAAERQLGFVLDTVTWRANRDWGASLGYDPAALERINHSAVAFARSLAAEFQGRGPVLVNGVIGPRGDAYRPETAMTAAEARLYHRAQVRQFADAGVDMVSAITMPDVAQALGVALVAREAGIPSVVSFTVETDGTLPSGQSLRDAIEEVDEATQASPVYYMVNCAHPAHFEAVLAEPGAWRNRIGGVRANASAKSHAELDVMTELDAGDPADLGRRHRALKRLLPRLSVFGGCCGTDHRHVRAICDEVLSATVATV